LAVVLSNSLSNAPLWQREKFADSDLIGIPVRFVVSDKTVVEGKVEVKLRNGSESKVVSTEEAIKIL